MVACFGCTGSVLGLGAGLGLGYLIFGLPWRNSGGLWLGKNGGGVWFGRRRKRRAEEADAWLDQAESI